MGKMPFTHVDIQKQRRSKSLFLFLILVAFYFAGSVVLGYTFLLSLGLAKDEFELIAVNRYFYWTCLTTALTLALLQFISAIHGGVDRIINALRAEIPDPSDRYHKQFMNVVEEVKLATGYQYLKPVVVPTLATNAFAIATKKNNAVIGVTEGLLARLTRPQLENVVAHEMSHIINDDCIMVTIACSLFATYAQLLNQMEKGADNTEQGYPWLIVFVLWILTTIAKLLNMAISRQREYLADATAVKLTRNPIGLGEAMLKISRSWRGIGYVDASMAPIFIMNPMDSSLDEGTGFWANLFSTHPPIDKRLSPVMALAHTDIESISNSVESQLKARQEIRTIHETSNQGNPFWWILKNEKWEGPFASNQLVQLNYLQPDSWICRADDKKVMKVSDDPEVSQILAAKESLSWYGPHCPRCNQTLREEIYEGTTVFHCKFCDGYLVREAVLFRILARREVGFSEEFIRKIKDYQKQQLQFSIRQIRPKDQDTSPSCKCPMCSLPMNRTFYSYQYLVVIDKCYQCNIIWFDREELDYLQIMLEENI